MDNSLLAVRDINHKYIVVAEKESLINNFDYTQLIQYNYDQRKYVSYSTEQLISFYYNIFMVNIPYSQ